jgi:hypothetical protein
MLLIACDPKRSWLAGRDRANGLTEPPDADRAAGHQFGQIASECCLRLLVAQLDVAGIASLLTDWIAAQLGGSDCSRHLVVRWQEAAGLN